MAIDSSMLQLYGKPIFTIDGADDDLQFEQVIDFSGGENDYVRSTVIAQNQCQKLQPAGDILGQHKLGPFQLATVVPVKVEKSPRSCPAFNEMYLSISTSNGYMQLRNITVRRF